MSYRDYLTNEEALRRSPSRFKRADERTRTADLISLRVSGQWLPAVAHGCQSRISKVFSLAPPSVLHRIAHAVVSKWYQQRTIVVAHSRASGTQCSNLRHVPLRTVRLAPRLSATRRYPVNDRIR